MKREHRAHALLCSSHLLSTFSVCWVVAAVNRNPLNCSNTSSVHAIVMSKALSPKTTLFVLYRRMNSSVNFFLRLLNWQVHPSSMQQISKKTIASYSWLRVPVIVHLSLNTCACMCVCVSLSNVFLFSETKQARMSIDREGESQLPQTTGLPCASSSAPWARVNRRRGIEKSNRLWWQHEIIC